MERTTRRVVLPVVGLATAAVTTTVGVLPALAASSGANEPSATTSTTTSVPDGTYQSCSAYFGYGKQNGATELVEFDTAVKGGTPKGAPPTVANGGIDVVFEVHGSGGDDGNSYTCVPEQVTKAQWDAQWGDSPVIAPAYPGPGHYVYPSATPNIALSGPAAAARPAATADIGDVTSVTFRVTSIPEGYTLVSPTGAKVLQQNAYGPFVQVLQGQLPSVLASVVAAGPGGQAAAAALQTAVDTCRNDRDLPVDTPEALRQAFDTLVAYLGVPGEFPNPTVSCSDLFEVLAYSSFIAGARATTTYSETITVSLPVSPTTAPTTTPTAAQPAVVTPRFTG